MKKLILPFLLSTFFAFSQTRVTPDCVIPFNFTTTASTGNLTCGAPNGVPNGPGIASWIVVYDSTGFSALSLVVQSAPDNAGAPGSWATFAGTVLSSAQYIGSSGINPNTATTSAFTGFAGYYPWMRVTLASKTGTGRVRGNLYGYLNSTLTSAGAGGGGGGGCTSPCTVVQPTASALNVTSVETLFNGTAQVNAITCPNRAAVSISGSGETQIIAASGTTQIYICSLDLSGSAGSNFNVAYGTGSNCGTGTTAATGVYQNVLTYSSPWNAVAPLILPAGKAACLNFASSVTVGGTVIYAQF